MLPNCVACAHPSLLHFLTPFLSLLFRARSENLLDLFKVDLWNINIVASNPQQAAYHDHHHVCNKGGFGNVLLDWLCGTMDNWIAIGRLDGYMARARSRGGKGGKGQ